jgi:hypothetical protein
VNDFTTGAQGRPAVAMAGSREFLVVWEGTPPGGGAAEVFGRRYDAAGLPLGSDFQIGDATGVPRGVDVAADPRSGFVVVWGDYVTFADQDVRAGRWRRIIPALGGRRRDAGAHRARQRGLRPLT